MFGRRRIDVIIPQTASDRFRAGELVLVDVRTRWEYAQRRVPGSLHVPLDELRDRHGEIRSDRPAAFLCRSGHRSAVAARRLADERAAGVLNVAGGMNAWLAAGLPTSH